MILSQGVCSKIISSRCVRRLVHKYKDVIDLNKWTRIKREHEIRMSNLLGGNLYKDHKHPIYNFMFRYFHFKESILFDYSPGSYVLLQGVSSSEYRRDVRAMVVIPNSGIYFDPTSLTFAPEQIKSYERTLLILERSMQKTPNFHCFGLHEWAMLYRPQVTSPTATAALSMHQHLPLRLDLDAIAGVVEAHPLFCTHFDASRFFTAPAQPLNRASPAPTRANQPSSDQAGCLHTHMDLFKWSVKLFPFVSSDILFDTLDIAIRAREIDMRASPYDLTAYTPFSGHRQSTKTPTICDTSEHKGDLLWSSSEGVTTASKMVSLLSEGGPQTGSTLGAGFSSDPIRIETLEGRREYQRQQKQLYLDSLSVRLRLLACYRQFLEDVRPFLWK